MKVADIITLMDSSEQREVFFKLVDSFNPERGLELMCEWFQKYTKRLENRLLEQDTTMEELSHSLDKADTEIHKLQQENERLEIQGQHLNQQLTDCLARHAKELQMVPREIPAPIILNVTGEEDISNLFPTPLGYDSPNCRYLLGNEYRYAEAGEDLEAGDMVCFNGDMAYKSNINNLMQTPWKGIVINNMKQGCRSFILVDKGRS